MKQIIQDLKSGDTILEEVPTPVIKSGHILIKTTKTLVSLGTERMLVQFGKANFIQKAKQQPDKVKMVLNKVKTDGLKPTVDAVLSKLNQPLPLGYCNVGKVVAVGKGVSEFKIGDRLASNGHHAEYVLIPKNLAAKIPDSVSDDEATFTVIGSIGLQGIRLLNPTFGETIVVVGLGLIGLVTAELLLANGCQVIGFDFDTEKIKLALEKGITAVNTAEGFDPVRFVASHTNNVGADGVIITASNKSNEIISQAANMCRKRGRVILVGVIGLHINRADFYEKEISFQVSCSYGAGRYDETYEQKGQDYPIGYVRWTEKRNFQAILQAIATKKLVVNPLITQKIPLANYRDIYLDIKHSNAIASIIEYDPSEEVTTVIEITPRFFEGKKGVIGIIGAGNFTGAAILPALKKINANIKYIASAGGLSSTTLAKRFGIANATSDYQHILADKQIDLVFITTKHNIHASMVLETLQAGKHVFVEKPLAISQSELNEIIAAYQIQNVNISVGFNRRFAPLAQKMKQFIGQANTPMNIVATMNAGFIPPNVWLHDMEIGGGRIIGEACHYIDLCTFLSGSTVKAVCMNAMGVYPEENTDNASILLQYENGTNAVINYFANGSKAYAKERLEVYRQECTLVMDNWRSLKTFGFKAKCSINSKQDKGHNEQFKRLIQQQQAGGNPIIPFSEIVNTTQASFAAIESLKRKRWIAIK